MEIKLKRGRIVALERNKQIGYLTYKYPSDMSGKRNLEILYIYVSKDYRRKGIGSSMVRFLLKKIEKKKIVWLSLWTSRDIEENKATNFYKKLGFKKLATQKDYYKKDVATTLFAKKIGKN